MSDPLKRFGQRRRPPLRREGGMNDTFEKFTNRARIVMTLAQDEAQRLGHNYMGTEHLLLGLVREGEGVAAVALERLGVSLEDARAAVLHIIGHNDRIVAGDVGLTPRAKKVIELAVDEARRMGHHYIGTEHLLLGLLREGEGIACGVLESLGVNLERARIAVIQTLASRGATVEDQAPSQSPSGPKNNVITCRLDDATLNALDILVEAGVRSTRSDAAAWLIGAGIEAHRPLIARVTATVEEIRRLRDEARAIASETLPAKGASAPENGEADQLESEKGHEPE
jgi:ATP-dependent Clp protease ATP-binding subunit ClpA